MKKISFTALVRLLTVGLSACAFTLQAANAEFDAAFDIANKAYTSRKWQEGADLLVKARELAKTDWEKYKVNYRLTYCYSYIKQNEKAIETASEALKYPKLSARDRNRFANMIIEASIRLKRYDDAMKQVELQLAEPAREDDMYYITILHKGVILHEQKKYAEAIPVLKKAESYPKIEVDVKNKVQWYIGASAMKNGDKATARTYFEQVAKNSRNWFGTSAKKHLQTLSK